MTDEKQAAKEIAESIVHMHETMPTERGVPLAYVSPSALQLARAYLSLLDELEWEGV